MWCCGMGTKRILGIAVRATLLLVLFAGPALLARRVCRDYGGISLRVGDAPVSERKLKTVLEEENDGLRLTAAWSRGKPVALTGESLGTGVQARPVTVYGDVRQVCPMELLSGGFPVEDDLLGCTVTADVAMALFHSVDAVGAKVTVAGKPYTVRGVVKAYEPMAILRGDGTAYENLEFSTEDPSCGAAATAALLYRHSLSGTYVTVESGLYGRMLGSLAGLPGVVACLMAAGLLLRAYWPRRRKAAALLYLLPAVAALALLLPVLRATFYWPRAYLPTRCSDLAFWGALWRGWRENWRALTLATPLPKDVQFYQAARGIALGTALALLMEAGLYRRIGELTRSAPPESMKGRERP